MDPAWHRANPLGDDATTEARIAWHLAHMRRCACQPVPAKLLGTLRRRGLVPR